VVAVVTPLQVAFDTADLSTYTFSGQNLGTPAADRYIVVCSHGRKGSQLNLTSVSVAGVSATIVAQERQWSGSCTNQAISIAHVPAGASGDVVVVFDSSAVRCHVALYALNGIDPGAILFSTAQRVLADAPLNANVIVPANGVAISTGGVGWGSATIAWAGLTQDFYDAFEVSATSSASLAFAAEQSPLIVTNTWSVSGNAPAIVTVSWGPAAGGSVIQSRRRRQQLQKSGGL
jgi:hypothetical protein